MEDRYTSMSAPELAGEDSFIRWIIKGENNEQWLQWQQAHPNVAETISEATTIVKSLSIINGPSLSAQEKESLWNRIDSSVAHTASPAKKYSLIKWAMAAAATLALVVWINSIQPQRVYTGAGKHTEVVLPETSVVTVNAGSDISYKKNFDRERIIHLSGEAFFKVKPGSTFKVITDHGTVTVLGTSFNVISRPGWFEVSCYTGKVLVENKAKASVEITPGEKAFIENDKLDEVTFTPGEKPEWMAGKFNFNNQPLSAVVSEFERQFGVEVDLAPGLEDLRYTGLFEKGDRENALYMITWPLHLKSETKGNRVSITR